MLAPPRLDVVSAVATASPKGRDANQDRVLAIELGAGGAGVVVCDGVGAYAESGAVAELVAHEAGRYLRTMGIHRGTRGCARHLSSTLTFSAAGATTLIMIGANLSGDVAFCFVGNGGLVEVQMLKGISGVDAMRWVDLVLPHISVAGGRPALRSFFPATNGAPVEKAVGAHTVDPRTPRLYLACTDGVTTDEERAVGQAPDGSLWKAVSRPLASLLDDLHPRWDALLVSPTAHDDLGKLLQATLDRLLETGALDDDASVGALLVRASPKFESSA